MSVESPNDPRVAGWFEGTLRRRFGVPDGEPVSLRFPRSGSRALVAVARLDRGRVVVAKLIDSFSRFARLAYATRRLHAEGLPVPELLVWKATPRVGAMRAFLVVESYLPERDFSELDTAARDRALDGVARALARLHSVRRRHHGPLLVPSRGAYVSHFVAKSLARLEQLGQVLPTSLISTLRARVVDAARSLPRRDGYELIHGHIFPANVRVDGARAAFIDIGSAHFGDFARDVVRVLLRMCEDDAQRERFLARYLEHVRGVTRDDWERLAPFYLADVRLAQARSVLRSHRNGELSREQVRERLADLHTTLAA